MILQRNIPVEKSLRYAVRESNDQTEILLYVLHGYGQLSRYFLSKLEDLFPGEITIVAPEGMHRFYLNGHSGRVGASWMTKEARELDINENTAALDRLNRQLLKEYRPSKIAVIGFSQGGATAARWLSSSKEIQADLFVSWASVFPPDVELPENCALAQKNIFVVGTQDRFFPEEALEKAIEDYSQLNFEIHTFSGEHDVSETVLSELLQQYLL